jgi:hypothetical protein
MVIVEYFLMIFSSLLCHMQEWISLLYIFSDNLPLASCWLCANPVMLCMYTFLLESLGLGVHEFLHSCLTMEVGVGGLLMVLSLRVMIASAHLLLSPFNHVQSWWHDKRYIFLV